MEEQKLWRLRLERDLQHCQWRKCSDKTIACTLRFVLDALILYFLMECAYFQLEIHICSCTKLYTKVYVLNVS